MTFVDSVGSKAGSGANKRYQKTYAKKVNQNKQVQPFSYLDPIPPGQLGAQANQQVQAGIQPVLKNLNKMFTAQLAALNKQYTTQRTQGVADIGASADSLGRAAAAYGPKVQHTDDAMIHGQQLLDEGIRSFLADTGQQVVGGVTQQQQAAGAPTEALQATAAGPGQLALGIQGEALGRGASTLSSMLSQRAADVNYANFVPTLAGRAKQQDTALYLRNLQTAQSAAQSDVSQQRSAALGDITSKVPGLVSDVYSNLYQQEVNKAVARKGFQMDEQKLIAGKKAAKAPPALHLQHKVINHPDGTQEEYDYDPATGAKYNILEHKAADAGVGGSKAANKKFTDINKSAVGSAQKRLKALGKTLYGHKDLLGSLIGGTPKADQKKVIDTARSDVTAQVEQIWMTAYPNKDAAWYRQRTWETVRSAGWRPLANILQYGNQRGIPRGKRTTAGASGGGGGTTTTKTTTTKPATPAYPVGENAAGGQTARQKEHEKTAKAAADQARAKGAAATNAATDATSFVNKHLNDRGGPFVTDPVGTVVRYLRGRGVYPNVPDAQLRGIARSALATAKK